MSRRYAELQCSSHFSFLRGASGCDELFSQAAVCGLEALAITDLNSVAGIVRAHEAAKATGVRLIVGDVPLSFHPAATRVLGLVTPRSVG
ncbi:PHP domain-containing protein [Brevundimonas sp. S1H14]|uniref:PHP domain-containing protein n=1 Tax=Brevundimonas sp. S1H14 TaxID=3078084 RepID=UPI0039E8387A